MRQLNSIGLAGMVLAAGAVSPAVMAQTVDLYYGPYAYYVGGEFTAVTVPNLFNGYYAPSALVTVTDANNVQQTGFETFCAQTAVDFTPYNWGNHTPYNYRLSLSSIGNPDNFPLSVGAAYLYWQFATGQLQGYNYTDAPTRTADAGVLQSALWALQGEQSYGGYPSGVGDGTTGNPYYNLALKYLGFAALDPATFSTDFGVEILNLTQAGDPTAAAQNQFVYTGDPPTDPPSDPPTDPVPDRGATLALLSLSLAGLAAYAHRFGARELAPQHCRRR